MIRSFIALELPAAVREQIGRLQEALQADGIRARWVRPDNIHLTLHFFGDVSAEQLEAIRAAMVEASEGGKPIRLAASGVGVFPGIRKARVLWSGVTGELETLSHLQQRLTGVLDRVGFPISRRRFKAHLTLGRFRKPPAPAALAGAIEKQGGFSSSPFTVSQLTLFESRLTPAGAIYTKIHEMPLGGGLAGPQPAAVDRRTT